MSLSGWTELCFSLGGSCTGSRLSENRKEALHHGPYAWQLLQADREALRPGVEAQRQERYAKARASFVSGMPSDEEARKVDAVRCLSNLLPALDRFHVSFLRSPPRLHAWLRSPGSPICHAGAPADRAGAGCVHHSGWDDDKVGWALSGKPARRKLPCLCRGMCLTQNELLAGIQAGAGV